MKVSVFLLVIFLATCQTEDRRVHPHCVKPLSENCAPEKKAIQFYYDPEKKRCIYYFGCQQSNLFLSLDHCHNYCEKTHQEVCRTPFSYKKENSECMAYGYTYTYEPSEKKCKLIEYKGCGKNTNAFLSLKDCENYCANV